MMLWWLSITNAMLPLRVFFGVFLVATSITECYSLTFTQNISRGKGKVFSFCILYKYMLRVTNLYDG